MSWTSIFASGSPAKIAAFVRENPIDIAHACGFDLLTDALHGQWMRDMLAATTDLTLHAHRGSYKTTCLSVVIPILMITDPATNLLFLRKTDDDVSEIIAQVRRVLQSPALRGIAHALHGRPLTLTRVNRAEIDTSLNRCPGGAPQLLGMGVKGSLTGKHAGIIITDDIVNQKDRISRAEREMTKSIYQELQNIKNRGGRILNTGTPWHRDDACALMPDIRRYDCYRTGLIDADTLAHLRRSMEPSLFAANYELQHIASGNALITTAPVFQDDPEKLWDGRAHIDAGYGGDDCTALTLMRRDGDTLYAYGRLWRAHVDACIPEIRSECLRLRCAPVYCENNADKGYLVKELTRQGMPARGYHEAMNKYQKISAYLRKWWGRIVWLSGTDPDYISQILDYTEDAAHDDAPDSAACLCRMLDRATRSSLLA